MERSQVTTITEGLAEETWIKGVYCGATDHPKTKGWIKMEQKIQYSKLEISAYFNVEDLL